MSRLGISSGFVTSEPALTPKRLTLKLQVVLNQQPAIAKTTCVSNPKFSL